MFFLNKNIDIFKKICKSRGELLFKMKTLPLVSLLSVLLGLTPRLEAQTTPGAIADVVLQFKLTGTDPATVSRRITGEIVRDDRNRPVLAFEAFWEVRNEGVLVEENIERVTRLSNGRYGNKEFLEDLVEVGVIDSIAGWSLKFVQPTFGVPEDLIGLAAGDGWYFLVHRDSEANPPIPLNSILYFDKGNTQATSSERTTQRFGEGGVPTTNSRSFQETTRQDMDFIINFDRFFPEGQEYHLVSQGIYASGMRLQFLGPEKRPVFMPAAGKLSSLSGRMNYNLGEPESRRSWLVEGGMTQSAGKFFADVGIYVDKVDR